MNSDDVAFGGDGLGTKTRVSSKKGPMHGFENNITLDLPGLSFILLKRKPKPVKKPKAEKTEAVAPKAEKKAVAPKAEPKKEKAAPKAKKAEVKAEKVAEEPATELEKLVAANKAKKAKKK